MAILVFSACSSTAARLLILLGSWLVAGAQVPAQPRIGFLAVGFSRLDQTVKLSAGHHAFGRVTDNGGPDRTLCRIVVDRQVTGFGVAHQLDPVAGQVADGFAQGVLSCHLKVRLFHPAFRWANTGSLCS